ncbi:helix-turn-helix domain-containing protein [Pseudomonas sp. Pseusp97]|uniref:helix-turn-helix domain-containing protein n=1 Tax=Pseudomonas sp. Pseusp97 TaxID=3243065 RepID=UPI0039A70966
MSAISQLEVFQSMNSSPNARLERCAELGDGLSAAIWSNSHDARDYHAPSHHTLSCYLNDGTGTFRRGAPGSKGAPDKLCVMPAGAESAWIVNGDIRLAHLYIGQEQFALGCIRLLDREPRELQLHERTFLDDPQQAARFRQLVRLDWHEPGERIRTSTLAHDLIDHLLLNQVGLREGLKLKGGLAPVMRRRVADYIEQRLDQPLSLGELAMQTALSEYHFARMFRESFGMPPHQYVLARRVALAQRLLRDTRQPLSQVALACGFSSASHFANRFRSVVGGTPGEYRQAFGE